MIYIILIAIALVLIAAAVTCQAVWYRRKWKGENSRRWQETSIMLTVENEKDAQIHNLRIRNSLLNHEIEAVKLKNRELQDSLSSLLIILRATSLFLPSMFPEVRPSC